jgi:hypothetical protein
LGTKFLIALFGRLRTDRDLNGSLTFQYLCAENFLAGLQPAIDSLLVSQGCTLGFALAGLQPAIIQ